MPDRRQLCRADRLGGRRSVLVVGSELRRVALQHRFPRLARSAGDRQVARWCNRSRALTSRLAPTPLETAAAQAEANATSKVAVTSRRGERQPRRRWSVICTDGDRRLLRIHKPYFLRWENGGAKGRFRRGYGHSSKGLSRSDSTRSPL